jgi:hypothetical protein
VRLGGFEIMGEKKIKTIGFAGLNRDVTKSKKKMKILGIGNSHEFNYLIIKKEEGFFEWLNELLVRSFGAISPDIVYYEEIKKGEKMVSVKKDIKKIVDIHEFYDSDAGVRVDLFFGKNKVFMTFCCSPERRKRFMYVLDGISEFQEGKE